MPGGVDWPTGLTIEIEIQSPYPGDEDQYETLHIFTDKGTWQIYLITDRKYRAVSSEIGPWLPIVCSIARAVYIIIYIYNGTNVIP